MLLNLSKDGCMLSKDNCILSKDSFSASIHSTMVAYTTVKDYMLATKLQTAAMIARKS